MGVSSSDGTLFLIFLYRMKNAEREIFAIPYPTFKFTCGGRKKYLSRLRFFPAEVALFLWGGKYDFFEIFLRYESRCRLAFY